MGGAKYLNTLPQSKAVTCNGVVNQKSLDIGQNHNLEIKVIVTNVLKAHIPNFGRNFILGNKI